MKSSRVPLRSGVAFLLATLLIVAYVAGLAPLPPSVSSAVASVESPPGGGHACDEHDPQPPSARAVACQPVAAPLANETPLLARSARSEDRIAPATDASPADRTLSLQQRVTGTSDPAGSAVLTYTLTFSGSKEVRLWDPLPETVSFITDSLTANVMPSPAYSTTTRTVHWQGLPPDAGPGVISFQVTANISNTGGMTGTLPPPLTVTNTAWLMDVETETTISTTVTVILFGYPTYLPFIHKP